MEKKPVLGVLMGDSAGVGPELVAKVCASGFLEEQCRPIIIGDVRILENALKVVKFLEGHPKVAKVNHPSLASHPDHALYGKYFPKGGGSIFTFEVKGTLEDTWKFIDSLKLFSLLANVADMKSLVIHPYTTTHSQMTPEELEQQHITPTTVRLSIGVEHIDDILADLSQAFDKI